MRLLAAIWLVLAGCLAGGAALDHAFPPPLGSTPVSRVVTDARGLPLRAFPVEDGRWRLAADLDGIDPRFIEALLLIEDKRFFEHGGIDVAAVARAARDNIARGRVVSGASTITMQTARLLEPRPRTVPSKLIEMFRARQIERRLTKREILELYLTLAPYGGNLQGVRTASLAYFGRDPEELRASDIALLLALPQSPEARRPDLRPQNAATARNELLERLAAEGWIEASRASEAAADPLPVKRRAFPADAWHFAEAIETAPDERGIVRTGIERPLQAAAERLVRRAAERAGPEVQVASMIVRLEDRAIAASVGSAGLGKPGGWLDLTGRRRSPGSTLKPLIYGLAMQEGIAAPGTLVRDLPTRFGSYEPQNFGRDFSGELTVATALQHSLNVPAVLLLDLLGPERLVGTLRSGGIEAVLPEGRDPETGLAVALGGLGMTAQELVTLYAALGDGGLVKPLAWTAEDAAANPDRPGVRILSDAVSAEVLSILRRSPSVAGRLPAGLTRGAPDIAFKTGTSWGYRDAWAVGVGERHAAIVWIGRADGAARPGITGRSAALPVLFELFDAAEGRSGGARRHDVSTDAPHALAAVGPDRVPHILFPPDGATLWPRAERAFVLAGRGQGTLSWYADGRPIPADKTGDVLWQPAGPGFYRIAAVDGHGRKTVADVRVAASGI